MATPEVEPVAEAQPAASASKKRILIVEDEAHMMEMLKFRLVENQYEVATAADGYAALIQVRNFKPDLIILDLMLPKMDGYTICRLLKCNDEYRTIPVMILSARSNEEDIRRGLAMGADVFMKKPYDPPVLLEKIRELLARDRNALESENPAPPPEPAAS
jgi:two-component system, OmpR family, phosphate regulon response regulator PhoB